MDATPAKTSRVTLRLVTTGDLEIFFEHQVDPEATRMAAFAARDRDAHMAHWQRIMDDPSVETRAVLVDGRVAGNIVSWEEAGKREVGYWIGRSHWGQGVATAALSQFLHLLPGRPLYAHVALHNMASVRVLEKCGFVPAGSEAGIDEMVLVLRD